MAQCFSLVKRRQGNYQAQHGCARGRHMVPCIAVDVGDGTIATYCQDFAMQKSKEAWIAHPSRVLGFFKVPPPPPPPRQNAKEKTPRKKRQLPAACSPAKTPRKKRQPSAACSQRQLRRQNQQNQAAASSESAEDQFHHQFVQICEPGQRANRWKRRR